MGDWEPVDWRGEDGTDFFEGLLIGCAVAVPFWLALAWLLGVF